MCVAQGGLLSGNGFGVLDPGRRATKTADFEYNRMNGDIIISMRNIDDVGYQDYAFVCVYAEMG